MKHTFTGKDAFEALYAAQNFLKENGYSYGSLQRGDPVGILRGEVEEPIPKWRYIDPNSYDALDGVMIGDKRNGPVTVLLGEEAQKYLSNKAAA